VRGIKNRVKYRASRYESLHMLSIIIIIIIITVLGFQGFRDFPPPSQTNRGIYLHTGNDRTLTNIVENT
jgi:hypothetical protein